VVGQVSIAVVSAVAVVGAVAVVVSVVEGVGAVVVLQTDLFATYWTTAETLRLPLPGQPFKAKKEEAKVRKGGDVRASGRFCGG